MKLLKITNKQLKKEYLAYDEMVNSNDCYGIRDCIRYHELENEILKRDGKIIMERRIRFEKNIEFE